MSFYGCSFIDILIFLPPRQFRRGATATSAYIWLLRPACCQFDSSTEQIGLYLADLLGGTETGIDELVFRQFPTAEGMQSLVAVAKVGDSGMLNLLNPCPDFQGNGIGIVTKETIADEFCS